MFLWRVYPILSPRNFNDFLVLHTYLHLPICLIHVVYELGTLGNLVNTYLLDSIHKILCNKLYFCSNSAVVLPK